MSPSSKTEQDVKPLLKWKHYSVVIFIFILGVIIMLITEGKQNNWFHFIGEIGAFVSAAIASHFIYDRFIRKGEESFLTKQLEMVLENRMAQFEYDSGIIQPTTKLQLDEYINSINTAKNEVYILQTWVPNFISLEDSIKNAIHRRVIVKILLLNPRSSHAGVRGKELVSCHS